MKKRSILVAASMLLVAIISSAQETQLKWIDPIAAGAQVHGQGWAELESTYVRLPDKAHGTVREDVWNLSRNSAGLSLVFRSNATEITVRYKVKGGLNMFHFPSTGVSGIDMYAYGKDGKPLWCAPVFTATFTSELITYRYLELIYGPGETSREFQLYLPTYNTVESLEIGVPMDAELTFLPKSGRKPVVVYGTSIAQGACASRPGNAWTAIIGRKADVPVVNLGFSGNGRLEPEVFELLAEIDAAAYVIDCLPNMSLTHDVEDRLTKGIAILRKDHDCPIILVEHSGTSSEYATGLRTHYRELNSRQKQTYDKLRKSGVKGLYYITHKQIYPGLEGQVEGVHFNDLGMYRQADAVAKKLDKVLRGRR